MMDAAVEFTLRHWYAIGPLVLLCAAFFYFYMLQAIKLGATLRDAATAIGVLWADRSADPARVKIEDHALRHLWLQYCDLLHEEWSADPDSVMDAPVTRRATAPADAIFNGGSVIDGRLRVEFFRHLPGLLTGLGIICTFGGLIDGLGVANVGGVLKIEALIASVHDAFLVSAAAIVAAMLVTFLEKAVYAWLLRQTEALCHQIDSLYAAIGSEDYLARLVRASEQASTSTAQLGDNLVGELRDFLLRLTERQMDAAERQEAKLVQQIAYCLTQQKEGNPRRSAEAARAKGGAAEPAPAPAPAPPPPAPPRIAPEQLEALVDKLGETLGRQLEQNREMQAKTLEALDAAAAALQDAARGMSAAKGAGPALEAKTEQMSRALAEMAGRQGEVNNALRMLIAEMRGGRQPRAAPPAAVKGPSKSPPPPLTQAVVAEKRGPAAPIAAGPRPDPNGQASHKLAGMVADLGQALERLQPKRANAKR